MKLKFDLLESGVEAILKALVARQTPTEVAGNCKSKFIVSVPEMVGTPA